jgi:heme/copper-type cytochrome/quinol oxidase subunit 1
MLLAFGFYDIVTLAALMFILVSFMVLILVVLGLPGRIAKKRNHPEAEAVNLMGWVGFLGVVPWIQALIWSIKETDVIDIRRFPEEERESLQWQAEKYQAESAKQSKKDKGTADQADSDTAAEN